MADDVKQFTVSAAPFFIKKSNNTRRIMMDVLIALSLPVLAAAILFGYQFIVNWIVCLGICLGTEFIYGLIDKRKKDSYKDLSCLVTGTVLALILPAKTAIEGWDFNIYIDGFRKGAITGFNDAQFYAGANADAMLFSFDILIVCVIGSIIAIALAKMLFGGIGKNVFNPAAAAKIFLLICFGFAAVNTLYPSSAEAFLSGDKTTGNPQAFLMMFLGNQAALNAGAASIPAIMSGCVYLCIRKVIDFRIPLIGLGCFMLFTFVFDGMIAQDILFRPDAGARLLNNLLANILSGGFMFALVFMAGDYSSSPSKFAGKTIFIAGFAFITVIIRAFTKWPEGAFFALVIMNALTPLLDKYLVKKPSKEKKAASSHAPHEPKSVKEEAGA